VPAAQALKLLFPKDPMPLGCSPDNPWWQLWPHIHGTDGFFGAVFQKKAATPALDSEKAEEKAVKVKAKKAVKTIEVKNECLHHIVPFWLTVNVGYHVVC
jgi:16S rRNA (cytosine967-C5)-methyltransferase